MRLKGALEQANSADMIGVYYIILNFGCYSIKLLLQEREVDFSCSSVCVCDFEVLEHFLKVSKRLINNKQTANNSIRLQSAQGWRRQQTYVRSCEKRMGSGGRPRRGETIVTSPSGSVMILHSFIFIKLLHHYYYLFIIKNNNNYYHYYYIYYFIIIIYYISFIYYSSSSSFFL